MAQHRDRHDCLERHVTATPFRTTIRATPASSKQSRSGMHQKVNSCGISLAHVSSDHASQDPSHFGAILCLSPPQRRDPTVAVQSILTITAHDQPSQSRRTAAPPQPTITTHNHHPNQRHHEAGILKSDSPHWPNGVRTYDIDISDGSVISGTGALSSATCALCLSTPLSSPGCLPPFLNFPTPRFGKCHSIPPPLSLFLAWNFTGALIEGISLTF